MSKEYSLTIKNSAGQKDLLDDFGFVVTEIPYVSRGETKDLAKVDYPDEDGEDVYIPQQMKFKARTMEVKVCYTCNLNDEGAKKSAVALDELEAYLASGGAISVYSPWTDRGFTGCSYGGAKDAEYSKMGPYEVMEATLVFNVHNPMSTYKPE